MKNTIFNALGLPAGRKTNGEYGLEIEAEGRGLPEMRTKYWRTERDGSLAAGMEAQEYVFNTPLSLEESRRAIDELANTYKLMGTQVEETETSGVHVHVNVQDYTPREFFTLVTTYLVLEELLLTYCGPYRQGNHFCLSSQHAEGQVYELVQSAINRKFGNLNKEAIRYSSMNVYSLFKYGSVEFRAMRGTPDLEAIWEWMEIIDRVKNGAKQFKNPQEVILSMSMDGEKNFITQVLGDKAKLFIKVKGCEEMVRRGAQFIQALAFVPDWKAWKDEKVNPFPKKDR